MENYYIQPSGIFRLNTATLFERYFAENSEFKRLELTLDRLSAAAEELDVCSDIAKNVIHIAGTNGKGSTAYFIEQILAHRGLSTALFTSPHIHSVTERIRLNASDISVSEFDRLFELCRPLIEKHQLSYFETLTLIGFKYFKDNMPDAAIIETGLGGRLDSTNILDKKIPVITTLSMDHTDFLGDDILKITDEKIAIIKNNLLVFAGNNSEYVNKYLDFKLHTKTIVRAKYSEEPYRDFQPPFADNLRLAEAVSDYIIHGTMPATLKLPPCRDERFGRFVLDGAHNEEGLQRLADRYAEKNPIVIYTSTSDRDTEAMLGILSRFASRIILTSIPGNERSIDPNTINTNSIKETDPESALKIAVELSENADILVCGSLYLCAHVREILAKGML